MFKSILSKLLGTSPQTTMWGFITALLISLPTLIEKFGIKIDPGIMVILQGVSVYMLGRRAKETNGISATEDNVLKAAVISQGLVSVEPIEEETQPEEITPQPIAVKSLPKVTALAKEVAPSVEKKKKATARKRAT